MKMLFLVALYLPIPGTVVPTAPLQYDCSQECRVYVGGNQIMHIKARQPVTIWETKNTWGNQ